MKTSLKVWTMMVLGSTAIMAGISPEAVAGSDVRVHYNSSSYGYEHSSSAGILMIDGRKYTIRSYDNIGRQIVRAFRRSGYEASIDCGKLVVCFDPYDSPRVRWYNRGYRASFCRDHGRLTVSWNRIPRSSYSSGYGYNDGHGWNSKRSRGRHHKPRRRVSRQWCD